jgi:hypothetical protein
VGERIGRQKNEIKDENIVSREKRAGGQLKLSINHVKAVQSHAGWFPLFQPWVSPCERKQNRGNQKYSSSFYCRGFPTELVPPRVFLAGPVPGLSFSTCNDPLSNQTNVIVQSDKYPVNTAVPVGSWLLTLRHHLWRQTAGFHSLRNTLFHSLWDCLHYGRKNANLQGLKEVCGTIFTLSLQSCPGSPLVIISPTRVRALELHLHILLECPAIGSLCAVGIHASVQGIQPREEQCFHILALGLGGSRAPSQTQRTTLFQAQVLHFTRDTRKHGQARSTRD